jgi:organic radical activating enzyme
MPKNYDETLQEYKARIIDPISASFCSAKWDNATIWLGSGTTASCHHPPAHRIDLNAIADNPSALHNTVQKKFARAQMLKGERPSECEYCWKMEDMHRNAVSDRVFKTIIYTDEQVAETARTPHNHDVNPKTLEIAFDRACNFACSYCNASFSTTWGKDIKTHGPYPDLISDGGLAYAQDGTWAQPYKIGEPNPYVEAFWRWWPELSKTLEELRVTGGEPMMSPDFWRLLDYFEAHTAGDIRFAVNSNLGVKDDLIDRLISQSQHIKHFSLYTSCETIGAQAEYIRDGLVWETWVANIHKILSTANLECLNFMMTINSLCLFGITDFLDEILKWKGQYGMERVVWSVNLLRFPSFQSPSALPDHIKIERRNHLRAWLKANNNNKLIHDYEAAGIARLIDYLEMVADPHGNTSSMDSRFHDIRAFYDQYDQRRGKNIRAVFPQAFVEWYDSL